MRTDPLAQLAAQIAHTRSVSPAEIIVLEGDTHLSDEQIAGGRVRTIVVLERRASIEAQRALVAVWRSRAAARISATSPIARAVRQCADELEAAIEREHEHAEAPPR